MDASDAWVALLLGVIEGLTEFLPVSSTGHLIIAARMLGRSDDSTDIFIVVIQLGAILAVCWLFRHRLLTVLMTLNRRPSWEFCTRLLIAFLPAAIVGLAFHNQIKAYLFTPLTVASALVVGGIAILVIEARPIPNRVRDLNAMRYQDAFWVGIAQVLALIPGVSRAAATIMGGRLIGLSRLVATEFSFFLAIPVMFAAASFDLYQGWDQLRPGDVGFIAVGFIAAFACALVTIRWLLGYVASKTFKPFGWYRIAVGLTIVALILSGR